MIDRTALAAELKQLSRELGFDLVGIAPATPSEYANEFRNWLAVGRHASMQWMEKRIDERLDLGTYLPGAKSVISVAINYNPTASQALDESTGRIARYALGDDYHELIKPRLFAMADRIRQHAPDAQTRVGVDTAPILERELAQRAGLGWIGKNTLVLNEKIGSWILLGEIVTTVELPFDAPATNHCGTCRRCIDACPTDAIVAPYQLDARKCISYWTIEDRSETIGVDVGDWLFGCDICQEVCPFNSKAPPLTEPGFTSRYEVNGLDVDLVSRWTDDDYRRALKGSAVKRVKLPMLKRNARAVIVSRTAKRTGLAT